MKSERGSIENSFTIMIVIGLAAIIMIVVPLLSTAGRLEDIDQSRLQSALTNFVEKAASTGKITLQDFESELVNKIDNVNKYEVEIEIWKLDQNPNKKTTQTQHKVIGQNTYIIEYSSDVFDELYSKEEIKLEEGWKVHAYAYNTNVTKEQAFSGQANADISTHSAEAVATVRKNAD